jgi:long-chain acyl-CoA synthetase
MQSEEGYKLHINGIGYRRVTILRIKAYAAALYVKETSNDADKILNDPFERRLVITFFYDADKDEIQEALEEHFIENNPKSDHLNQLKEVLPKLPDIKEEDTLTLIFNQNGIKLDINGKTIASNSNIEFGRDILRIWLGEEPPNSSLKDGLLEIDL